MDPRLKAEGDERAEGNLRALELPPRNPSVAPAAAPRYMEAVAP